MAEWFVVPIMDNIINTCLDYLKEQVIGQTGMRDALERLQKLHPMIQSVVSASSQTQIRDQNPALNKWLWQLRDAIDEADDLLDEFEYLKHKEQLTKNTEETKKRKVFSSTSFVNKSFHKALKVGELALKIDPNLKRLEDVVQKLDKVTAEVGTFLHLLENTKVEQQEQQVELYKARETASLPKNDLIGRGKDKDFIMQWLRKSSNEERKTHITSTNLYRNISLLSIVGHGGMGKTTLLQHVYEHEMTKEFDLKMWVCVSNNFEVKRVISNMLESLKKKKPNLDSLDALQGSLKSEVLSKKFLLVLDDIWEEDKGQDKSKCKWEIVLAPLAYGSLGSKILITSRMDSVALMIANVIKNKKEILRLEGLEEDECLQLLNDHAFADVENLDDHKKLRSIAGEIVKKLLGSPLAAKVIGGALNSNFDERHWIKILNDAFGSSGLIQNDIFDILRLSYIFLPKPLQSCFAFCCIFPQDHEFDKKNLIRMWIALGFIQPSYIKEETVEDIGEMYFDALVKKSFFEKLQIKNETHYKMHDLLYELAQFVSAQECIKVVGNEESPFKIPKTIRHLSVNTGNLQVLRKIGKFKNLHSLFLTYNNNGNQDFIDVLTEIFEASRSIRLLCIKGLNLKMIPETIGYLIHLRYLKITETSVSMLPKSLSNLYQLQFIIFNKSRFSPQGDFLPRDMNNLSNLRDLKLPWDYFNGMHGIGKLKSLQGLDGFYVKNEVGYRIEELEHMNDLCKLRIKLLENLKHAEEACSAKLSHKRKLMDLSLEWGNTHINFYDWNIKIRYKKKVNSLNIADPNKYMQSGTSRNIADPNLDERVLDKLQPHNYLKKLRIISFMGVRSAMWMNDISLISNLEYIRLDECLEWQTLPPFGQLPFLRSLYLHNMPKVKRLDNKFYGDDKDCVFPSLEVLHIVYLEALEDWFDVAAKSTGDDCLFPCLTKLCLKYCPILHELPYLPPKLMKLKIEEIGWKAFNWLQSTSNCCIQALKIMGNDELVSFPIEAEQWFPQVTSSLRKLYFIDLKSLQYLPSSLTSLASLKILFVRNAPQLKLLPHIPATLEKLVLEELESLLYLPSSLSTSSLTCIKLNNIPLLKTLPDLPSSLCYMSLYHLENLYCLPSSLHRLSSLQMISISDVSQLRELPYLPSSSLKTLYVDEAPRLELLPTIPTSLERLELSKLKSLQCLPSSLSIISSLQYIFLSSMPLLKSLPDIPTSLRVLGLSDLVSLDCLPSCLSSFPSLKKISIHAIPKLRELPDLPASVKELSIINCRHPEFMERYKKSSGSNWHKIAHIPHLEVFNTRDH